MLLHSSMVGLAESSMSSTTRGAEALSCPGQVNPLLSIAGQCCTSRHHIEIDATSALKWRISRPLTTLFIKFERAAEWQNRDCPSCCNRLTNDRPIHRCWRGLLVVVLGSCLA